MSTLSYLDRHESDRKTPKLLLFFILNPRGVASASLWILLVPWPGLCGIIDHVSCSCFQKPWRSPSTNIMINKARYVGIGVWLPSLTQDSVRKLAGLALYTSVDIFRSRAAYGPSVGKNVVPSLTFLQR